MSLVRTAIRLTAVRALRGATWCGDQVRDSEQAAIEEADEAAPRPYLVVYTDGFTARPEGGDKSRGLLGEGEQELLIEITLTPRMEVQQRTVIDANGVEQTVSEPVWLDTLTDPAMEVTVEAIERQVRNALSSPRNAWGELFQMFALAITEHASHRGASHREGLRFVGRQLRLVVRTCFEPAPADGHRLLEPGTRWSLLLAALRADADPALVHLAGVIEAELRGDPTWTPAEQSRANWGLTAAEARALLMG